MLVAHIVELDNAFEQRMPHRTAADRGKPGRTGPWLTSVAMWATCLRFVGQDGVTVGELERLAGTPTNLNGMIRWRYVTVAPDPADPRAKPPQRDWLIKLTDGGRKAQEVWRPLFGEIEARWAERFGADEIQKLRGSLAALIERIDLDLPECLPILGYGLWTWPPRRGQPAPQQPAPAGRTMTLYALLSQVLLAFAIEVERECAVPLAIAANVTRVLVEDGVPIRDLPRRSGASKEAIAMATGLLEKQRLAVVAPHTSEVRTKVLRLTALGLRVSAADAELVAEVERGWVERFGAAEVGALRDVLAGLAGDGTADGSPLFRGLTPPPGSWRASVPRPETLPHFPMVLHRGGYPDGS